MQTTKPLPPIVASQTEQPAESLVNERQDEPYETNPEEQREPDPIPELASEHDQLLRQISILEQDLSFANKNLAEQKAKLDEVKKQKSNYSDVSRKFRIFLEIVNGMAARGTFDQAELGKRPGSELGLMRHAAGLAEVAQKATENRF